MASRANCALAVFLFLLVAPVLSQNRLTTPTPRINADITANPPCGNGNNAVQRNILGNVYYTGDTIDVKYTVTTAPAGSNINLALLQYSSQGTTNTLPTILNTYNLGTYTAAAGAQTIPAVQLPGGVQCLNQGECALSWQFISGGTNYYSCSDVYILSRGNDAYFTFYINSNGAAVPSVTNFKDNFLQYFQRFGTFFTYNVRGPATQPVKDGNRNYVASYIFSDGPIGWVNAQNMSNIIQSELATSSATMAASIFGASTAIYQFDVSDTATRAAEPSTSGTAIAVIVIFLILTAILLGVWYYYWKHHPQKLRNCMERTCPCFLGSEAQAAASKPTNYIQQSNTAPSGGAAPRAPSSAPPRTAPPARPQMNI